MPRVTVIIATYNWSAVLPSSIASVLDQTFTDFELLVVGDGCTDDSGEIVAGIDDPRVQWHNLPANTGHQSGPNNEGIRLAKGDVIGYLGHDDLWLPDHLELLVGAVDEGAGVAHGITLTVSPRGRPEALPREGWIYTPGDYVPPTAIVHTRLLVEAVGGWLHPRETGTLEPEMHLWKRMAEVGLPPQLVPRLTNVKLPAAFRPDVYRTRPQHEQAYWLRRIRAADDPEASLRAACAEPYVFAKDSLSPRIRHRIIYSRGSRWIYTRLRILGLVPLVVTSAEERWLRKRQYKGIGD